MEIKDSKELYSAYLNYIRTPYIGIKQRKIYKAKRTKTHCAPGPGSTTSNSTTDTSKPTPNFAGNSFPQGEFPTTPPQSRTELSQLMRDISVSGPLSQRKREREESTWTTNKIKKTEEGPQEFCALQLTDCDGNKLFKIFLEGEIGVVPTNEELVEEYDGDTDDEQLDLGVDKLFTSLCEAIESYDESL